MATQTIQNLPAQYVQDLGKDYATQLAGLTGVPLDTSRFAPQVAGQDALQTQAYDLTKSGIGAYQPYITSCSIFRTNRLSIVYVAVSNRCNRC